jgi:hypothetical protein
MVNRLIWRLMPLLTILFLILVHRPATPLHLRKQR